MKLKMTIVLFAALIALSGCSKGESEKSFSAKEQQTDKADKADKEIVEETEEETESETEDPVPTGKRATSLEELAALPPGELTKDFSVERETSIWIGKEVHSDIREAFLSEMEGITVVTQKPEELYGVFLHLLGGAQFKETIQPLVDYSPSFKEPILPEPYEINVEGKPATLPSKAIILLDASSSMLLHADGRLKMDTAKSAVKGFAMTIGKESDVSLYVYGHAGTQNKADKNVSCSTIDEVYPLGEYTETEFDKAVDEVKASGWTPLAGAIKQARLDHEQSTEDITLYIVSDGAETCDGDPVAEAKAFAELSKDRHVNVIGFQVDQQSESQLKEVAEAGNGTYMAADTLEDFSSNMSKLWLPSDLDLVGLMFVKADAWPKTMAHDKVRRLGDRARGSIRIESDRFVGAANLLEREGMIDESTRDELLSIIEKHREEYRGMLEQWIETKNKMINDEVDRIDKKIEDYINRMKELKKKN